MSLEEGISPIEQDRRDFELLSDDRLAEQIKEIGDALRLFRQSYERSLAPLDKFEEITGKLHESIRQGIMDSRSQTGRLGYLHELLLDEKRKRDERKKGSLE